METWLNLIGMIIELYGFVMVYKIKVKPNYTINKYNFNSRGSLWGYSSIQESIRDLTEEINRQAVIINEKIKLDDKKVQVYFWFILFGFLLQLLSVIISLIIYHTRNKYNC